MILFFFKWLNARKICVAYDLTASRLNPSFFPKIFKVSLISWSMGSKTRHKCLLYSKDPKSLMTCFLSNLSASLSFWRIPISLCPALIKISSLLIIFMATGCFVVILTALTTVLKTPFPHFPITWNCLSKISPIWTL